MPLRATPYHKQTGRIVDSPSMVRYLQVLRMVAAYEYEISKARFQARQVVFPSGNITNK